MDPLPLGGGRVSATGRAHHPLHYCQQELILKPQNGLHSIWGYRKKRDGDTYTSQILGSPYTPPPPGVSTSLTGGQGLLQFLRLLFVCDDQGVKVSAAPNFKLHIILIFLDLDSYQRDQNR